MDEPNWNLLPHSPAEFFGLTEPIDRKALKRAYTNLIKRYKPEQHPAEFQRIRAAYEALDSEIRYGVSQSIPKFEDTYRWGADTTEPTAEISVTSNSSQQREAPLSLSQRLDKETPQDIYQKINAKTHKSPFDFYTAAILADIVSPNDSLLFFKWLLTGLKQYPQDPALYRLLSEAFRRTTIQADNLPKLLLTVSKILSSDRYFALTEPLWDQLLSLKDWNRFQQTLIACEKNLVDHRITIRLTFYIQLLRKAIWLAPRDWCEDRFQWINQNASQLPDQLEFELEITNEIYNYLAKRDTFVRISDITAQMDQSIRAFCLETDEVSDEIHVRLQARIATAFRELHFDLSNKLQDHPSAITVWRYITEDVAYRLDINPPPLNTESLVTNTISLMRQIDQIVPYFRLRMWSFSNYLIPIFAYTIFFVIGYYIGYIERAMGFPEFLISITQGGFWVALLASIPAYFFWLLPKFIKPLLNRWIRNLMLKHYAQQWREYIGRFAVAFRCTTRELLRAIEISSEIKEADLGISQWLPYLVSEDIAIHLFMSSQRFVK